MGRSTSGSGIWPIVQAIALLLTALVLWALHGKDGVVGVVPLVVAIFTGLQAWRDAGPLRTAVLTGAGVAQAVLLLGMGFTAGQSGLSLGVVLYGSAFVAAVGFVVISVLGWALLRVLKPDVVTVERDAVGGEGAASVAVRTTRSVRRGRKGRIAAGLTLVASVMVVFGWREVDRWPQAAMDPDTGALRRALIWRFGKPLSRAVLLANPSYDLSAVRRIARTTNDPLQLEWACRNPQLDQEELFALYELRKPKTAALHGLAQNPSSPTTLLAQVAAVAPNDRRLQQLINLHRNRPGRAPD